MFNSDTLHEMYEDASNRGKELQYSITKQRGLDIAYLFKELITEKHIKEPYLTDRQRDLFKFLKIENGDLKGNSNIEEIKPRLRSDYSFFKQIPAICGYCCMGQEVAQVLQKFVYEKEYENLVKYSK